MKKEKNMQEPKVEKFFVPQEILDISGIKNPPLNNDGAPIWMDFQPGSYVDKDGNINYSSKKKTQYVDKELIKNLFDRFVNCDEDDLTILPLYDAINFWLSN